MKKFFPILLVLCWACQPDEASPADRFVRSYGLQGNSSLNDVIELENGNLLLCGKMAKPAFNSNLNSDNSSGSLEESAPALILTDPEGQLLEYRLYPIQSVEKDPIINISRLAGSASFLEIQALDNGGYLAAGEFRGFGFNVGLNAPEPEPEARNTIPFLARFNANLELVEFTPPPPPPVLISRPASIALWASASTIWMLRVKLSLAMIYAPEALSNLRVISAFSMMAASRL